MAHRELILIRHGQSTANVSQLLSGWSDVPLTQRGREQACRLRPLLSELHVDAQWTSDLLRTRQTAEHAWDRVPWTSAHHVPALRELNFGDYEGKHWNSLAPEEIEQVRAFEDFDMPGGESLEVFEKRVLGFVDALSPGSHLIFTHGGVIRLLLRGMGVTRFVGNCALVRVDWDAQTLLEEREGPS